MANGETKRNWGERINENKGQVALGVVAAGAVIGFAEMGPKGFDADEAAKNWSPSTAVTEQELLETMSMKDRYGLELNDDGTIGVYEDLLKVVGDANNLSEQLPNGSTDESDESDPPPIVPLSPDSLIQPDGN